ncbi:RNFT2 family protein [Megaselia abdita]
MSSNTAEHEVRLEIPEDDLIINNEPRYQQIINNVLAQTNQSINTFLEQQPSSPPHISPGTFNRGDNIPAENSPPEDQNDDQYIIIWITILKTLIQYVPIVLILLLKCTFENFKIIVEVLLLHAITWYLNLKYKGEVAKKAKRSKARLVILLLYILAVVHFLVIYLIGETTQLGLLLYYSETNLTLSQLLYQVILTDCILKLFTIFSKICITILPLKWMHFKQRSRTYAFIENLSQFYRCSVPFQIWLDHFFFAYSGWKTLFGALFSALYIGYKGFDLNRKSKPVIKCFLALYRNVNHGRSPTEQELGSSEKQCPICHDDFTDPVILECSHIFCESCVTTWFVNEQTCPLCRAKVAENPTWQCGSTSLFYQIY